MNLPKIQDLDISGKKVIVRLDLDVPPDDLPPCDPEPPLDLALEPEVSADFIELMLADFDAELVPFEKPAPPVLPDPEELDL